MIDDTGSNTFNLYYSEATNLGYHVSCDPTFQTLIGTAGAPIQRDTIIVEIQAIGRNEAPLTHWMAEIAALINPPGERLSGQAIRSQLYFATAPRTHHQSLYVSRTKTGLLQILPGIRQGIFSTHSG